MSLNCWEHKKCGREKGGMHEHDLGICPAYEASALNEVHGGTNGGRTCWVVAGTYCSDKIQGTFAEKERNCLACDFYKIVRDEEMENGRFMMSGALLDIVAA